MRFYGMSYPELMQLPIGVFWALNDCVGRVAAEEDQRQFLNGSAIQQEEENRTSYYDRLTKSVGTVFVLDKAAIAMSEVRDEEGWEELKAMAG